MESVELGNRILGRHMEITRSSFYAGRGPCTSDLHGGMLYGIFKDLYQVDKNYGENFIRLVDSIPSIGASDFIDAYDDFARNDFNFEKKVARRNIAVIDGRTYKEKMQSATCNALGTLGIFSVNKTKEQAAKVSNGIKEHFYRLTKRFYEENVGVDMYDADESVISDDIHRIIDPYYRSTCEFYEEHEELKKYHEEAKRLHRTVRKG